MKDCLTTEKAQSHPVQFSEYKSVSTAHRGTIVTGPKEYIFNMYINSTKWLHGKAKIKKELATPERFFFMNKLL